MHAARVYAQSLADETGETYVIWAIGWRTLTLPEGKEVQGGQVIEYVYPQTEGVEA